MNYIIDTLTINGQTFRNQDFLDLILALQNSENKSISVIYKVDKIVDINKRTEYVRNIHTGAWVMVRDKGIPCNQRIRVAKENRQYLIQYI